jgi:hypothetical protein
MPTNNELLYAFLSVLENPVGLSRPHWMDFSRWDTEVNYDQVAMASVLGVAARSSIGNLYTDPWFENNWAQSGRVGIYRTGYHVIHPDLTVVSQLDRWYLAMPSIDRIPRVIDLEVSRGQPSARIAQRTWDMSEAILARDGVRPIIYSRANIVNSWLVPHWSPDMLNAHYWWLAQYLWDRRREHPGPPTYPTHVKESQVIIHQTADKKPPPPGVTSRSIADHDRWEIGNEQQMHAWIESTWGSGPVSPPDPPDKPDQVIPIERVMVLANALNVRELPDASSKDLGELTYAAVVPVVETNGPWKKISGWIHGNWTKPM